MSSLRIAVIGAGLAGISAATALNEANHMVTIFDKSRGSGGRMSSKRTEVGDLDLGAQYFTARDSHFRQLLQQWLDKGWVAEWTPRLFRFDQQGLHESADQQQRFVGTPRMSALSRHLIGDLRFQSQTRIAQVHRDDDNQWQLSDDVGAVHGPFDRIVVAVPAPQAVALLKQAPLLAQAAAQATMDAGWTLALAFEQSLPTPVEACFVRSGPLDWISRNSTKPGRGGRDTWVVQSTPGWAADHLDADHETIATHLQQALSEVLGLTLPSPASLHVHRWLYARPTDQCNWGALAAPELGIYVCGDWCLGGRLENAWLSGQQAAKTVQ
ncbi:MAG TPA: FAD-dependent oxidoreductase [Pseudomonas xinjiangensis]|uniref:FAD-dependent oxidoreductase n=2 Tax=root TaxID=1 RepID=A0A7V1BMT1_9GAMM|nr:FAD-dependent oxidoreductase [Halopseudomonas xinjiangensis]HEC49234.1 FAD-dependent oxidoreductase [Halopseudomonas xinjiangensis]